MPGHVIFRIPIGVKERFQIALEKFLECTSVRPYDWQRELTQHAKEEKDHDERRGSICKCECPYGLPGAESIGRSQPETRESGLESSGETWHWSSLQSNRHDRVSAREPADAASDPLQDLSRSRVLLRQAQLSFVIHAAELSIHGALATPPGSRTAPTA
jgi:hypothetical protein